MPHGTEGDGGDTQEPQPFTPLLSCHNEELLILATIAHFSPMLEAERSENLSRRVKKKKKQTDLRMVAYYFSFLRDMLLNKEQ